MFFVLLLSLLTCIVASLITVSLQTGISPMPTSRHARRALLAHLPEDAKRIFELGSGWGGLAFALSRERPNALIYAYELSPIPWLFSRILQKIKGLSNLRIDKKDFLFVPLQEADVVICYLCPKIMEKLKPKFERELKNTTIISYCFSLPNWIPEKIIEANEFYSSNIFIYKV
jgi:predicted RNA methylase